MCFSVVGFQPPGATPCPPPLRGSLVSIWLFPGAGCTSLSEQTKLHSIQSAIPGPAALGPDWPPSNPRGLWCGLKADSLSCLPAKAGPAGNQLPALRPAVRAGTASVGGALASWGAAGVSRTVLELADTIALPPLTLCQEVGRLRRRPGGLLSEGSRAAAEGGAKAAHSRQHGPPQMPTPRTGTLLDSSTHAGRLASDTSRGG